MRLCMYIKKEPSCVLLGPNSADQLRSEHYDMVAMGLLHLIPRGFPEVEVIADKQLRFPSQNH